ncbi:hypothetical protein QYE76_050037 [Lolium multiflorum]|uniref:F-box domain-containing protein n=1 Tax=Lolium multiflorum TaxID=4521 RepID=A0AAD8SR87_LOLMU|nr:hypothetical protein QYE76_050037 [Lolium multiflorum]
METAAATAIALPDDLVREILLRVADPTALFRLAVACKQLRALIVDPSFLRRRWPEDSPNSSTLAGFFAALTRCGRAVFVPAPRSPISSSRRFLSSFYEAASFLDNAVLLTSRRGLLLVRISQRDCGEPNQLAVCNVLAGTCDVLPPLPHDVNLAISGFTVLTAADCCSTGRRRPPSPAPGYSSFFKVLIHGVNQNDDVPEQRYYLSMFSSDEPSWTSPQECFNHNNDIGNAHGRGSAVVSRDAAHWLFGCTSNYYTLNVSIGTGRVSLTKLLIRSSPPFNTLAPQLSIAADGTLALLHLRPQGNHVDIWTCQETESGDGGTAEWPGTRTLELKRPKQNLNGTFSICVGERSDTLLFADPFLSLHVANLQTGATEDARQQFEGLGCEPTVPLMMDWPSVFMSRLGDSSEKRCMWYQL